MWIVSSCKQVIRWWSEGLDRDIPWWCRLMIRIHTGRCGPCARYQKQVLATREMHRTAVSEEALEEDKPTYVLRPERKEQIVTAMDNALP